MPSPATVHADELLDDETAQRVACRLHPECPLAFLTTDGDIRHSHTMANDGGKTKNRTRPHARWRAKFSAKSQIMRRMSHRLSDFAHPARSIDGRRLAPALKWPSGRNYSQVDKSV